jgi:hypothetical protein
MTKFDRAELVRGAIAHYSNLAHHMGGDGAPWSASAARMRYSSLRRPRA